MNGPAWRRRRAVAGAALLVLCATAAGARGADRPNVVLIVVDDLGWSDLSCQGSTFYETPRLDRLAAEGLRFTQAYAACAVCSPTRAAVLTGRYPDRTGVTDWIRARFQRPGTQNGDLAPSEYVRENGRRLLCPPNPFRLELEEVTVAEALRAAGYATCHIGKWHLGDDAWYPEHQGFDFNLGGCDYGQPPSYFDPYANARLPAGIPTLAPRREGEYLTDREADEAVRFIETHREKPFFLYLAHHAVHTPLQARAALRAKYEQKPGRTQQKNATYAAMIESVDEAAGRVLDTIDRTGLGEKTLVLFTSDNGGLASSTHNGPLRSGKGYPYEGGIRVPLIVRWPGTVAAGRVSAAIVTSVDYFPTILAAAGVEPPRGRTIDGVSLLDHLRSGGVTPRPPRAVFWHFPHYRAPDVAPYSIVREGAWKLIRHWEGPTFELFDLENDFGETENLSARRPEKVAELDRLLLARLSDAGAKLPRPDQEVPRVLLLGDSISIAYTPFVRDLLASDAVVVRPMLDPRRAENCAGTTRGLERLDDWLSIDGGGWDVIHFNFGLHDMKRVHPETAAPSNDAAHPRQADPAVYRAQLSQIVARLAATKARLIFATTTPVPRGRLAPHRDAEDPARYNRIAREVLAPHGVLIDDLHAAASERLAAIQEPENVHFTAEGSELLARAVAGSIRAALRAPRE